MGLVLIILGLVVALFLSFALGVLLIVIGVVLLFVPGPFYGYSWYRGRHPPP